MLKGLIISINIKNWRHHIHDSANNSSVLSISTSKSTPIDPRSTVHRVNNCPESSKHPRSLPNPPISRHTHRRTTTQRRLITSQAKQVPQPPCSAYAGTRASTNKYQLTSLTFCLVIFCSWLPLLFIPVNSSPLFILTFVSLTYLLHRPCIYCSLLLLILFASSCHWSDRCFFDVQGDWFSPRFHSGGKENGTSTTMLQADGNATSTMTTPGLADFVFQTVNSTSSALGRAAWEKVMEVAANASASSTNQTFGNNVTVSQSGDQEWTGIGIEWLRSLLGKREWVLPCLNVKVRL